MRLFVMICISRIVLASLESWCVIVLLNLLVKLDNSLYSCVVLLNKKKVHAEPTAATTKLSADA